LESSGKKSAESSEPSARDLRLQLKERDGLVREYLSRLRWLQAEFENYKKRVTKEREELTAYANEGLVTQLLDVSDNFERAIGIAKREEGNRSIIQGLEMVYTQLQNILKKEGLVQIKAVGEPFDPFKHEAVMRVSSNDHKDGTIVEEIQKGYFFKSKVIRPSRVKVVKNP